MARSLRSLDVPTPCGHRSDGRPHDTGLQRPMRPCPHDFRERFIELGWGSIEDHYRTNWRVIRRWIEETGGADLRATRAAYVEENGRRFLYLVPIP
jgi:hypothetical protein